MARELGLNPRSLIKNIPSPIQQWKLPVRQWIHELYEKKTGKMPGKKRRTAQSLKRDELAANGAIPLQAYANELSLMPDNEHSTLEATTMADREEYADELRDDNGPLCLPESPLYGVGAGVIWQPLDFMQCNRHPLPESIVVPSYRHQAKPEIYSPCTWRG